LSEWHSVTDVTSVVLMGDPSVASIPVAECGEALVTATEDFVVSSLKDGHDPYRSRVREGVYRRLVAAQAHLPAGLRISWVEGHRDPRLQERYFNNYRERLEKLDPRLSDEDSYLLASRYVSPPRVAPHVSGAAIDLTLCDQQGDELDMGTPVNATPEDSNGACYFGAAVSAEARSNRAVMAKALEEVGLVNYPTEWWHWSYGDRYWAMATGESAAIYGPVAT
jgi:D-alanyl-D-alanine dipeptidase